MNRFVSATLGVLTAVSVLTACSNSPATTPSTPPVVESPAVSPEETQSATQEPAPEAPTGLRDIVLQPPAKNWQEALEAAKAGFDGKVIKIELDSNAGGALEYEIELLSADTEYSVRLDAENLNKLAEEKDPLTGDDKKKVKNVFDPSEMIDLGVAADAARDVVEGTIHQWKLEGTAPGQVVFEYEIVTDDTPDGVDVKVNAVDGSLIS